MHFSNSQRTVWTEMLQNCWWFSTSIVELKKKNKKKTCSIFLFFSSCPFGSWVVHLEVLNQILRWKNNNMGIKENDIFLGVYFLLPNKVLKSIWVDMWKNCTCLLPLRMNCRHSSPAVKMMVVGGITKGDSPCRGRCWASRMCGSKASSLWVSFQYVFTSLISFIGISCSWKFGPPCLILTKTRSTGGSCTAGGSCQRGPKDATLVSWTHLMVNVPVYEVSAAASARFINLSVHDVLADSGQALCRWWWNFRAVSTAGFKCPSVFSCYWLEWLAKCCCHRPAGSCITLCRALQLH